VVLDFTLRNLPGWVEVTLESNHDPGAVGAEPTARDFPVCTATIAYRGRGYLAALGWIQLVRSTDNASGGTQFELDPYTPLGRSSHPFCWFGFCPTLFDAPVRDSRAPLEWTAHSFVCFIAKGRDGLEARAVLGFGWGFTIRDEIVSSRTTPSVLGESDWNAHRALLGQEHPGWSFAEGFHSQ
jgi:hypothetical protein